MANPVADREHPSAGEHDAFRLFIDSVRDYAIFMLDRKGYRAAEIIGKHFSVFYPPADVESGLPAFKLRVAAAEGKWEGEGWRIRADGTWTKLDQELEDQIGLPPAPHPPEAQYRD